MENTLVYSEKHGVWVPKEREREVEGSQYENSNDSRRDENMLNSNSTEAVLPQKHLL